MDIREPNWLSVRQIQSMGRRVRHPPKSKAETTSDIQSRLEGLGKANYKSNMFTYNSLSALSRLSLN